MPHAPLVQIAVPFGSVGHLRQPAPHAVASLLAAQPAPHAW
jgi:hypothetical protein